MAIALGSNLGDRQAHLTAAASALASVLSGVRLSSFIDTDPVFTQLAIAKGEPPKPRAGGAG